MGTSVNYFISLSHFLELLNEISIVKNFGKLQSLMSEKYLEILRE